VTARAVASLLEDSEEVRERERIPAKPFGRTEGTTVWVDVVESDEEEEDEGAGE
jgi:hypothetical protein